MNALTSALSPLALVAILLSSVAAAVIAGRFVRPTRRLAGRVRPYTVTSRTSLGRSADVRAVAAPEGSTVMRLIGPIVNGLAGRLSHLMDSAGDDALAMRLRQAGMLREIPEPLRAQEYRVRQLGASVGGAGIGAAVMVATGRGPVTVIGVALLGFVIGATRLRGRLDRAIEDRRARMRIELYTVNQLLAMNVRVGGGVVQAVRRVTTRGNGAVVEELTEILRAHESGMTAREAFDRAARATPEPNVARTYRLLAAAAEYGADLAEALLEHSEDIREARREALRRAATKRRAAMLLPIIAILAPVMLLFIAAPIPSIVFGAR